MAEINKTKQTKTNKQPAQEYFSLREVAEQSGQSYGTVKRAVDSGRLAAYRIGRKFFVPAGAAQAYCQGDKAAPEGYTLQDIMAKLHLSYAFVSRLVRSGALKSRKVGRQYVVSEADFAEFMQKNRL